jgi:hypothetical protein
VAHDLEKLYDLSAEELLEAINRRFRLKVALEGAVAEVQFERKLKVLKTQGRITNYEGHDTDGMHDFTLQPGPIRVEIKNVRNLKVPTVEIQKTRTSNADSSSRFYGHDQFDLIGVCMGKATGKWSDFAFALTRELPSHPKHQEKLAVLHPVCFPNSPTGVHWYGDLEEAIAAYERRTDLFH